MRFLLVTEGPSDLRRIRLIFDAAGVDAGCIVGPDDATDFLPRKSVTAMARERRIRISRPGLAGQIRTTLLLVRALERQWEKVMVLFDTDGSTEMVDVGQLGDLLHDAVVGVAHECGEAWVLEGFDASDVDAGAYKRRFGFDPFRSPERLSHKANHERSAKRLLEELEIDEGACMERLWAGGGSEATGSRPFIFRLRASLAD